MNKHLREILNLIQQDEILSAEQKAAVLKSLKDADKELEITTFKLDRTEKVKRTTAILLEETIAELEQKRKAVEAQNRELEIETALERVRTVAMSMNKPDDMLHVCRVISEQLQYLDVREIRNVQTAIFYEAKGTYINYEFYAKHNETLITEVDYKNHSVQKGFADQMLKGPNEIFIHSFNGKQVQDWYEFQKTTNVFPDTYLETADSLNYYWYSLGPVALGFSTYKPLSEEETNLFKRFVKVFELSYRRYLDIEKAEAQAKEAQIEAALERVRSRTMAMQKSDELKYAATLLFQQAKALGVPAYSCGYNIWEKGEKEFTSWMSTQDGSDINGVPNISLTEDANFIRYVESKQKGEPFFVLELRGERMQEHYQYLKTIPAFKGYFDYAVSVGFDLPQTQIHHVANFSQGNLLFITLKPCPEFHDVFKRFAVVFEQTYTRFLDLQKAEAQAREAKIEAALERTRTQSMIMQHSKELDDTLRVFHEQVLLLGINSAFSFLWLPDEEEERHIFWAAWEENNSKVFKSKAINYPLDRNEPATAQCLVDWKSNEPVYSYHVPPPAVENYFALWQELIDGVEQLKPEYFTGGLYYVEAFMKYGCFGVIVANDLTEDEKKILGRFAIEFERTYTRFLDLQKAEAQAREAKIEAALEKVRSKTMAMHNSLDVGDTVAALFDEFVSLGIETFRCGIGIIHQEKKMEVWTAKRDANGKVNFFTGYMDMTMHPLLQGGYSAWKKKEESYIYELKGDDLKEYFSRSNNNPNYPLKCDVPSLPSRLIFSVFYFPEGFLFAFTLEELPSEATKIFKRFSGVFGQTYRRYLDLQKAEAQAREAQIEAAMERVRSRSMAMQKSEELKEVIQVVYEQFVHLNIQVEHTGFIMDYKERDDMHIWLADKHAIPFQVTIPYFDSAHWNSFNKAKEKGLDFFANYLSFEEKNKFYRQLFDLLPVPEETKEYYLSCAGLAISTALLDNIGLYIENFSGIPYSDEENNTLMRFGKVFQQTYTRFLDLQKAEAQVREATIEAALERVRSRTMAMRQSNELAETSSVLFQQIKNLGFETWSCGFCIWKNDEMLEAWMGADSGELLPPLMIPYKQEETHFEIYKAHLRKEQSYHHIWEGGLLKKHYQFLKTLPSVREAFDMLEASGLTLPSLQCYYVGFFKHGYLLLITKEVNEELKDLSRRFAQVFDLTYTRFLDLQKAEGNAKEAIRQAALDRIRADIASMRTTKDLQRITPLIWNELNILGVPFIRCGVFIMNDEEQLIHTFLSTPDGKAIAAFHIPYNTAGNIKYVINHWHNNKSYIDHWDEDAFITFAETLVTQGALTSPEQYLQTIPTGGFYLHFLPFLQGMLYVGNTIQLRDDEINVIQSIADAFSTAYARYEDFNKLESAKQQVDKTLVELKQTQQQLVQSEKMASLGELTAGIAHEIQNPLNFVNNFSDVNKELLAELAEEIEKGNYEEVKILANDVIGNEEKISHHGRRADAIVKGMLQHSRSSSGQKEPTDINVLADEYLRLAYHGLRAKDKSFNATLKTDYDKTLKKVNVIPQDVGRVILNLITNAFYAIHEKANAFPPASRQAALTGYEPTISISTKNMGDKILISVKDNGGGIPQRVVDKIFQPFFTTKPTGQGTGLGLSLSYDIIKAHGGEIKVETKEGKGSEFIIQLPVV